MKPFCIVSAIVDTSGIYGSTLVFTENAFYSFSNVEERIKDGLKGNLASLFAASLWWIWWSRNAFCLSNKTTTL